jgi:hypothetical protein
VIFEKWVEKSRFSGFNGRGGLRSNFLEKGGSESGGVLGGLKIFYKNVELD